jgi:hypothetical protein
MSLMRLQLGPNGRLQPSRRPREPWLMYHQERFAPPRLNGRCPFS